MYAAVWILLSAYRCDFGNKSSTYSSPKCLSRQEEKIFLKNSHKSGTWRRGADLWRLEWTRSCSATQWHLLTLLRSITGDSVVACLTLTAGRRLCDQSKLQLSWWFDGENVSAWLLSSTFYCLCFSFSSFSLAHFAVVVIRWNASRAAVSPLFDEWHRFD